MCPKPDGPALEFKPEGAGTSSAGGDIVEHNALRNFFSSGVADRSMRRAQLLLSRSQFLPHSLRCLSAHPPIRDGSSLGAVKRRQRVAAGLAPQTQSSLSESTSRETAARILRIVS